MIKTVQNNGCINLSIVVALSNSSNNNIIVISEFEIHDAK